MRPLHALYPVALLAGVLAAASCWGCVVTPVPQPIPVPQPNPPEPPQPQPIPIPDPPNPQPPQPTGLTRATFAGIEVGGPASQLDALPAPDRVVRVPEDGREVRSWVLDEPRPDGGSVRWEVHVRKNLVIASFAW